MQGRVDLCPHRGDDVFLDFFDTRRTPGCDPAAAVSTLHIWFRFQGPGFRAQGLGFRFKGAGFRA
jgi:hypothetical protein